MKNKFLTMMKANKNWLTVLLFVIAVLIITTMLLHVGVRALPATKLLYFTGFIALFFALLNPWGRMSWKYYLILLGVLVVLSVLPFFLGDEYDLVKIQARRQIPGHWAEDMAWSIGFILFTGYLAGIIGLYISIRRRK
jgi:hypothetical protein